MKKLLALTALVGTTVSIATACGTDTLAMVDNVTVKGFTAGSEKCTESADQTLTWDALANAGGGAWVITNTYFSKVSMEYTYTVKADGDYSFYAVVANAGKKHVDAKEIKAKTSDEKDVIHTVATAFTAKLAQKAFWTCETLTQTTKGAAAFQPVVLTSIDPVAETKWVPVVKDSTPEQAKTNGGYKYSIDAVSAYTAANAAEWKKFFAPSKAQFSPKA